ncbi:hypothetical protein FRC11_009147 [Ceratobasidium sp. 423]|nr:hypothetical protein FRC11_009147 [Ceratobasidium sp. 423]
MIRASDSKGGNVLGLEPASDPLIGRSSIRLYHGSTKTTNHVPTVFGTLVVNYQFTWALEADDKKIYATIDQLISASMDIARSQGRLERYIYLNYASTNQTPLQSYGPTQVDFLRKVKAKYDPNNVFEKLSRGGFKIPS